MIQFWPYVCFFLKNGASGPFLNRTDRVNHLLCEVILASVVMVEAAGSQDFRGANLINKLNGSLMSFLDRR